jgi:hypothetical protein
LVSLLRIAITPVLLNEPIYLFLSALVAAELEPALAGFWSFKKLKTTVNTVARAGRAAARFPVFFQTPFRVHSAGLLPVLSRDCSAKKIVRENRLHSDNPGFFCKYD